MDSRRESLPLPHISSNVTQSSGRRLVVRLGIVVVVCKDPEDDGSLYASGSSVLIMAFGRALLLTAVGLAPGRVGGDIEDDGPYGTGCACGYTETSESCSCVCSSLLNFTHFLFFCCGSSSSFFCCLASSLISVFTFPRDLRGGGRGESSPG